MATSEIPVKTNTSRSIDDNDNGEVDDGDCSSNDGKMRETTQRVISSGLIDSSFSPCAPSTASNRRAKPARRRSGLRQTSDHALCVARARPPWMRKRSMHLGQVVDRKSL